MNAKKVKTNKYSVYMIKPEFQTLDEIVQSSKNSIEIDGVGHFVSASVPPKTPSWVKDFFGDAISLDRPLLNASSKGLLIVPISRHGKATYFAVVFGFGRHLLRPGVLEERFGLKTVLNSLDAASFRKIDKTTLGSVPKHSQEQMSRNVAATDFGIDIEQDLVSSVTGKSRDPLLGGIITGKDALSGSAKVNVGNIVEFLTHCLERYTSEDYKKDFDWIDQIAEVRDKKIEEELNLVLVDKLNTRTLDKVWMAVPEVIEWSDVKGFRYARQKSNDLHDDLDVPACLETLPSPVTLERLKHSAIFRISMATDDVVERWTVFQCMYAEVELRDDVYILNNAKWYRIAKGFTEQVQEHFDAVRRSDIDLPVCTVTREGDYTPIAAAALKGACCMDGELIMHGGGHSSVEFCDIYTGENKLLHIKRYGGSNVLSHLFSQGVVSAELFVSDADFRQKLNVKLPVGHKLADPSAAPNAKDYEVIYGIISESDKPLDIPFFSKVSLKNARRRLSMYGYQVGIKQIKKAVN
ncbi:MAG: TIGR04141 family sporadically distributed protein [Candidatus Vogelbacteria bacterium]|nr:TIGR04141 family sporadically distributed protein [Candidatus Vogelbacteria bacterium]